MNRRFAHIPALVVALLIASPIELAAAATHCGIDSGANGNKPAPMSTVVSMAVTRPADVAAGGAKADAATVANATASASNPTTAGGGIAAGGSEEGVLGDGGAPAGTHKRGVRWQSFLPGMIR